MDIGLGQRTQKASPGGILKRFKKEKVYHRNVSVVRNIKKKTRV